MSEASHHWDEVYRTKADDEVSWFQKRPEQSLKLITAATADRGTSIIDIGCGTGVLIGALAAAGYRDLTALDASAVAIARAQANLGTASERVAWIVSDIRRWRPRRIWDVWHDRAVFHFLTDSAAQAAYIAALRAGLATHGTAIIASFALDGPEKCSGLPVRRYSAATMAERLGADFRLLSETPERHVTPRGVAQSFIYAVFERR
jgi:SAM-dependent methyltransferase